MKKYIILLGFVIAAIAAPIVSNAQLKTFKSIYDLALDTVTNTGTVTMDATFNGSGSLGVQVIVDELSGTTAGNVFLQESIDGITYHNIDTLAPADVATPQGTVFKVPISYSQYYRISYTGSGTMAATIKATGILRKHE